MGSTSEISPTTVNSSITHLAIQARGVQSPYLISLWPEDPSPGNVAEPIRVYAPKSREKVSGLLASFEES
jgi:hypothetical protein